MPFLKLNVKHMDVMYIDVCRVQQLIIQLLIRRILAALRVLFLDTRVFIRLVITITNFHWVILIQTNSSITYRLRRVKIQVPVYCFLQILLYISNVYSFNYKIKLFYFCLGEGVNTFVPSLINEQLYTSVYINIWRSGKKIRNENRMVFVQA